MDAINLFYSIIYNLKNSTKPYQHALNIYGAGKVTCVNTVDIPNTQEFLLIAH